MRNINALFFHGPSWLMMFSSLILIATWSNHVSGAISNGITTCIFFTRWQWWFLWLFPSTLTKADSCLGVRPQDRCSSSLSSEEPNPPVGIIGIVGIMVIMGITFITNKTISVIIINQLATNQLVDTSSKFPFPKNIILVFFFSSMWLKNTNRPSTGWHSPVSSAQNPLKNSDVVSKS